MGAVDPRVALIVPIVMDELNFVQNIHHHFKSYGGWTFALKDYTELNFTRCLDHPNTQALMNIVDPCVRYSYSRPARFLLVLFSFFNLTHALLFCSFPPSLLYLLVVVDHSRYNYMEKLTMPKLVVNSGMDEFFLPDDTHFWWDKMPEPKHFLMIPNAEHSEATGILELLPDIYTYFNAMLDDSAAARAAGGSISSFGSGIEKVVPTFAQSTDSATGDITVTVDRSTLPPRTTLKEVNVWHATTCNSQRRDFRIINNGWAPPGSGKVVCLPCGIKVKGLCTNLEILWSKEPLNETAAGTGEFVAHRDLPPDGRWTAFFVDVQVGHSLTHYLLACLLTYFCLLPLLATHSSTRFFFIPLPLLYLAPPVAFFVNVQFAVAPAAGQAPRGERGDGGVTAEGVPRGLLGWPVLGKEIFEFTSEVSVIPQTFPFPDCSGANCSGSLV